MRGRRQRLLPKPPAPPEGYMWFYWQLVPIEEAEERAKIIMDDFDQLPRGQRDQQNYRPQRGPISNECRRDRGQRNAVSSTR
jgi:hypothetical protein